MSENDLETYSISRANDILKSIRDFRIKIDSTKAFDSMEMMMIQKCLDKYEEAESDDVYISEQTAKETITYYNKLLSRGAITENQITQKQFEELQVKFENEKKLRFKAEGRLEEYRRRYEGGEPSFTSEVTENESS